MGRTHIIYSKSLHLSCEPTDQIDNKLISLLETIFSQYWFMASEQFKFNQSTQLPSDTVKDYDIIVLKMIANFYKF